MMIRMYNVGRFNREHCTTQRRQVVMLQYLSMLMDSECNGVSWGILVKGESSEHNVTHVIVY